MSLNRIPFQSVNESKIEAIVGIQTSPTCRIVGIPAIASTTQRSRPSNCRSRPRLRLGRGMRVGSGLAWSCRCQCCPRFAARVKRAPAAAQRRALTGVTPRRSPRPGPACLRGSSRCSTDRPGSRRTPGPATFEANSGLVSRSRNCVTSGAAATVSSDLHAAAGCRATVSMSGAAADRRSG